MTYRYLFFCCVLLLPVNVRQATSRPADFGLTSPQTKDSPQVLILDVDNTLYCEKEIKTRAGRGIEEQIVNNIHSFCQRQLNMSPQQADQLHYEYGSTIEGIRHVLLENKRATPQQVYQLLEDFYREVYQDIDVSPLLVDTSLSDTKKDDTGYSHVAQNQVVANLLRSAPCPIYLASNSPSWHVARVLRALGLADVAFAGWLTPDTMIQHDASTPYPTKVLSNVFYRSLLQKHQNLILLDDSKLNIERAERDAGIRGIFVSHNHISLQQALSMALGHVQTEYDFSEIRYLAAKNLVDARSMHAPTWNEVGKRLADILKTTGDTTLCIADVGAGILSMLELIVMGHVETNPSLITLLKRQDANYRQLHYYAYEPNLGLFRGCHATLTRLGFVSQPTQNANADTAPNAGSEYIYRHETMDITVHLRMRDFTIDSVKQETSPPHLIVGCCFADLMDPNKLVQSMHDFLDTCKGPTSNIHHEVLVYFPITFTGTTQFVPPRPFDYKESTTRRRGGSIPSDTAAFTMYAHALQHKYGHNLNPDALISAMQSHGNHLLARGASDWEIDPIHNSYFWNTMMYFFGTVAAPELATHGWDAAGWVNRARDTPAAIRVSNVDLLFGLKPWKGSSWEATMESDAPTLHNEGFLNIREIQFVAPYQVTTRTKTVDTRHAAHLGPNQVEVTSVCSLISSGTELKIFKGLFDDAALDVNIKGMDKERMAYPLTYGYSLVGRVTRCGTDVKDAERLLDKLVFCFSPHASHTIVDRDSLHVVPDGIDARDAIFMPSVETALSLVHDAHVRVGENVAVFGQGLIGLLVTCILSKQTISAAFCSSCFGRFGTTTVFDTIPARLAAASVMGASEALMAQDVDKAGPFDVTIEVSGNSRALQSAIDHTSSGGRVIVGSWYGNADVRLKLGIDFHRSHKTIITSQVSELRAELMGLWTKQRRFSLAWELVRQIRPSRLVTKTVTLDNVQEAYELLERGSEIAVCFDYTSRYS